MTSPLIKKQAIRKQVDDCLNEHKDFIKYFKSVLLWHRPIDLGILILSVTALLWYSRNFNLSVITTVCIAIPLYYFITIVARQPILNMLAMVQPRESSNESYEEVVNILTEFKYTFNEIINELYTLKQLSPIKFFIQISIACAVVAFLGCYVSGYTLFITTVYSIIILPGFISNKHHESIVATVGPHIDNAMKVVSSTIAQLSEKFINQPQPSPATNVAGNYGQPTGSRSNSSFRPTNRAGEYSYISKKNS